MVYDLDMLKAFYASFEKKIGRVRAVLQRPLTLAEKILYTHLYDDALLKKYKRGEDYVNFRPDRVAMQDATDRWRCCNLSMPVRRLWLSLLPCIVTT